MKKAQINPHADSLSKPETQIGSSPGLSRRKFISRAGILGLGLAAGSALTSRTAASASVPLVVSDPGMAALEAASIGYKPAPSGVVPTVTLGSPNAASQISGSIAQPAVSNPSTGAINPSFRFLTVSPQQATELSANTAFVRQGNNSDPTTSPRVVAEFVVDGSQVELIEYGSGGAYRITIDGQLLSAQPQAAAPADQNTYLRLLDFGGARSQRLIRVEYSGAYFGGVNIGSNDTLYWSNKPLGARTIVLGDDLTVAGGASSQFTGYVATLASLMGWDGWATGSNGSGYTVQPPTGGVYASRLTTDVLPYGPEIVIVQGGSNDILADPTTLGSAATALYQAIQSNLPSSELIVIGPWCPTDASVALPSLLSVRNTLAQAAANAGASFIDMIGWITGTGNVVVPGSSGNAAFYIAADNLTATQAGNDYLAHRIATELIMADTL